VFIARLLQNKFQHNDLGTVEFEIGFLAAAAAAKRE
jgi:hypothetical protein